MIKKVLTVCHRFGEYCWRYTDEFLFPAVIAPTKTTDLVATIATARNTLAVGHRRRNSRVGEVI